MMFHLFRVQINTCDGLFLGAALLAITTALQNTRIPATSVESTDLTDLEDKFKKGVMVKKKSQFVFDMDTLRPLVLRDRLVYAGFLVLEGEPGEEVSQIFKHFL